MNSRAPILVLGLGNTLLRDDGVGTVLVERLRERRGGDPRCEFVDGGTLGLALLGWLEERAALLVLDAVALGAAPGTVHVVEHPLANPAARGIGAHGGNASALLGTAALLGALPHRVVVIGIEPHTIRTGTELDPAVARSVDAALARAERQLELWLAELAEAACTS
jgi:hydrogenase maturation protease